MRAASHDEKGRRGKNVSGVLVPKVWRWRTAGYSAASPLREACAQIKFRCAKRRYAPLHTSLRTLLLTHTYLYQKEETSIWMSLLFGGDKRDRTADLLNAIELEGEM